MSISCPPIVFPNRRVRPCPFVPKSQPVQNSFNTKLLLKIRYECPISFSNNKVPSKAISAHLDFLMLYMKNLLGCFCVGLSFSSSASETSLSIPVEVTIDVPSPAWSLKITSIHAKAKKLLIICNVQKKDGFAAAIMSKARASVNIPSRFNKLTREVYVTGQKWNYSKGYQTVTAEDSEKLLAGAAKIYSSPKSLTEKSFIGLTTTAAQALASSKDLPSRVIEIDGIPQIVTEDFRPERFNFTIRDGKVIRVTKG